MLAIRAMFFHFQFQEGFQSIFRHAFEHLPGLATSWACQEGKDVYAESPPATISGKVVVPWKQRANRSTISKKLFTTRQWFRTEVLMRSPVSTLLDRGRNRTGVL